jgi:hypothetical protein
MKIKVDEDLQLLVNELNNALYTYERALAELDHTCAVQSARIAELEAQLRPYIGSEMEMQQALDTWRGANRDVVQ